MLAHARIVGGIVRGRGDFVACGCRAVTSRPSTATRSSLTSSASSRGQFDQLLGLVPIVPSLQGRPGHGAVHGAGVEKAEAQPLGQRPGNRALAGAGRSVDGDDHARIEGDRDV